MPRNREGIMKYKLLVVSLIVLSFLGSACAGSQNPTRLVAAGLYLDPEGSQPTEKYDARAIFYCIVNLDQLAPDTVLQASWVAVETNRSDQNFVIHIEDVVPTSNTVVFKLENAGHFWPTGQYQLYLYLDGKESRVIDFEVYHDYFSE